MIRVLSTGLEFYPFNPLITWVFVSVLVVDIHKHYKTEMLSNSKDGRILRATLFRSSLSSKGSIGGRDELTASLLSRDSEIKETTTSTTG